MRLPKIGDIFKWDEEPHLVVDIEPATMVTYKTWRCLNMVTGNTQAFIKEEFRDYEWEMLA